MSLTYTLLIYSSLEVGHHGAVLLGDRSAAQGLLGAIAGAGAAALLRAIPSREGLSKDAKWAAAGRASRER